MKTGLILEGGGMRGIYSAGICDYLLEQDVYFDYVVGVSAGTGNASSYVSRQIGRTKRIITHDKAPEYFGTKAFARSGKLLDLDMLITQYAKEDIPFDFDAFFASETECEFVAVNCETGEAEYLSKDNDKEFFCKACTASCSLPFLCKPVEINGYHYLDGSIVDSIPVYRALEKGCDKLLVVLTKPEGGEPTNYQKYSKLINAQYKDYLHLQEALLRRVDEYERQKECLDELVREGRAMVIRPDRTLMKHLETDIRKMENVYQTAYDSMIELYPEVKEFLELK